MWVSADHCCAWCPLDPPYEPASLFMREILDQQYARFEELERLMVEPDVLANPARLAAIAREHGSLDTRSGSSRVCARGTSRLRVRTGARKKGRRRQRPSGEKSGRADGARGAPAQRGATRRCRRRARAGSHALATCAPHRAGRATAGTILAVQPASRANESVQGSLRDGPPPKAAPGFGDGSEPWKNKARGPFARVLQRARGWICGTSEKPTPSVRRRSREPGEPNCTARSTCATLAIGTERALVCALHLHNRHAHPHRVYRPRTSHLRRAG